MLFPSSNNFTLAKILYKIETKMCNKNIIKTKRDAKMQPRISKNLIAGEVVQNGKDPG